MTPDDSFFKQVRGFLTVYLPKNKCCSPNTVKAYRDTLNLFRHFLQEKKGIAFTRIRFDLITHDVVYDFLTWLQDTWGCHAATKNHRLAALKSFLHYCALEDPALMAIYLDIQQVRSQKIARPRVDYLSEAALKVLLEQPDPQARSGLRDRFLMILLYDTGARIQELLDLTLKDLHLNDPTPCLYLTGKGNKTRPVPLMDKTIEHLQAYLKAFHPAADQADNRPLFYTLHHGQPGQMSADNVSRLLKRYATVAHQVCSEVPLRLHAHLFRHTRAMHLYKAGIPLSYIKDFLGHASINTTDIYAAADPSMLRAALEKLGTHETGQASAVAPVWQGNEDMILKLCGLK
jgi:integrase/recombinase XerD